MKRPAWRSAVPLEEASGRGPVLLLLGGVGLGIIGLFVLAFGMTGAFSQMDRAGGPPGIFLLMQWIGFLMIPTAAVMVAFSFAWWIWRMARH